MELNQLTITEAILGLKKRKFSAQELTRDCLAKIKKIDHKVKAFISVSEAVALSQAEKSDQLIERKGESIFKEKPLLGIPVAIKDNFCTRGIRTTAGAKVLENYIPVYDATVVTKLKKAGAVILGKTNMDAWAHGSSTETSDFFTTKNPWNLTRLPGGSSGGSAAATIADETIFSIGSETAGSIRQPAAWCGVVGLKPTYGRVSRYGLISMASSLDCPGPITKTVIGAALVLQVLAGKDIMDATTSSKRVPKYSLEDKDGIKGIKIGVPKEYFFEKMDPQVIDSVLDAIKTLEKQGAEIKELSLLDPKYSVAVYTILQRSEVSSNLARYDGIRYGRERTWFGEEAKKRIMLGTYTLSAGYYDQYYLQAQKVRTLICQDLEKAFEKVDVLIAPTSPTPALKIGASKKDPMFGEMQDILVEPSTLAGLPGINLPCGFTKDNLPIGMQIIAPKFSEKLILQIGYTYQRLTDWHKKKPNL